MNEIKEVNTYAATGKQNIQTGVELGLTQAETVSLELGLIEGLTKTS